MHQQKLGRVVAAVDHPELGGVGITFIETTTHRLTVFSQGPKRHVKCGTLVECNSLLDVIMDDVNVLTLSDGESLADYRVVRFTAKAKAELDVIANAARVKIAYNYGRVLVIFTALVFAVGFITRLWTDLWGDLPTVSYANIAFDLTLHALAYVFFRRARDNFYAQQFDAWIGVERLQPDDLSVVS